VTWEEAYGENETNLHGVVCIKVTGGLMSMLR